MDSSVTGSLEYAAGHLKVPLLVVLGYTQCGAVGAAVSGAIRDIQKKIEPVVKEVEAGHPGLQGPELTTEVVKRNVFQVEADILGESEEIRELVEKGALKIVPAIYDVKTGKVEWLEKK
jgi:carbonic anhydrase